MMKKPVRKILIAEGDEIEQSLMARHLVNAGYRVQTSNNGAGMFLTLRKGHPDLILLNPNLPDGDGLDYARQIHQQTDIPIVIATVSKNRKDRIKALKFGVADCLTKPIDPREIILRIRNILNRGLDRETGPENRLNEDVTG
jgi:DNA-binding response OmpR family regulator